MEIKSDFLVIGSGIAGLSFALEAAKEASVVIVTKREARESATYYAQGGIASVIGSDDTFESHIQDTLKVGAGLCDKKIVEIVVRDGPERIRELMRLGVHFSEGMQKGHTELDLGREAGHSKRRIVHATDMTGKEIEEALISTAEKNSNIKIFEHHIAIDLITHEKFAVKKDNDTVWGAYVLDKKTGEVHTMLAKTTILSSGGCGKAYRYTSNPDTSTGDGIAMAYRAGAEISNMEFIQFHPTCLFHSKAKNFLISEAVRGEGAVLKLKDGTAFMERHHPDKELAPRDVVARAIDFELKKSGEDCVWLDISHKDRGFVITRFPNIYKKCLELGFDITKEPIPVVPAAHYVCGGIKTDENGKTNLKRLYAIGEAASTGLHGANRLASNSLLESLVFANRASSNALKAIKKDTDTVIPTIAPWQRGKAIESEDAVVISQNWDEIRRFMWNYVGVVRTDKRLERAKRRIELLKEEINNYYWDFTITSDLIELRNISTIADLIITSARMRKESRGLHYNMDYPETDDLNFKKDTVIRKRP